MTSLEQALRSPDFLLHRIDPAEDRLIFLHVSVPDLRAMPFIDGRTRLSAEAPLQFGLREALDLGWEPPPLPNRFIFHVGFCGSTLLARLLDRPGRSLVLREPKCLVDLAHWKAARARSGVRDERLSAIVRLACATLRASPDPAEPGVLKPSNWVNNLLPELCGGTDAARPLFVVIGRRPFIRAALRGGSERLAFTARAAAHFAAGDPRSEALLRNAVASTPDPLAQTLRLVLLAHHLQEGLFIDAMAEGGWSAQEAISFTAIAGDAGAAAEKARDVLDLPLSRRDIKENLAAHGGRHAKTAGTPFSPEERAQADAEIERERGPMIEEALAWARDTLPSLVDG